MPVDIQIPKFETKEFDSKKTNYCLCIPIINENQRIQKQLKRARRNGVNKLIDIIICDGGSSDGCTDPITLKQLGVNTLLVKTSRGKQGAQLRMGFYWALQRGYKGIITIDGNNKDSIESTRLFIEKLDQGFHFIQGSRFIRGGKATNTPPSRYLAVRLIHAPLISLTARTIFSDTTNAFRGYSKSYLENPQVQPFRNIFYGYELLAYLSVRASQLRLKTCEVPVKREYPKTGKTPTKISPVSGNFSLIMILLKNMMGFYNPKFLRKGATHVL